MRVLRAARMCVGLGLSPEEGAEDKLRRAGPRCRLTDTRGERQAAKAVSRYGAHTRWAAWP
jgi:hypothetical protein